jgi:hypothetical protein
MYIITVNCQTSSVAQLQNWHVGLIKQDTSRKKGRRRQYPEIFLGRFQGEVGYHQKNIEAIELQK